MRDLRREVKGLLEVLLLLLLLWLFSGILIFERLKKFQGAAQGVDIYACIALVGISSHETPCRLNGSDIHMEWIRIGINIPQITLSVKTAVIEIPNSAFEYYV